MQSIQSRPCCACVGAKGGAARAAGGADGFSAVQYIDSMLARAATWLSHHLPQQCLACHGWAVGGPLCPACWQRFAPAANTANTLRCTGCGLPLTGTATGTTSSTAQRCGACLRQPPPWAHCTVWVDYSYPWADVLTRWKLHPEPALARAWAQYLGSSSAVRAALARADLLLPIPLSAQRLRERGFNQSAQLAQHLVRQLARSSHAQPVPRCCCNALVRPQHTPSQRGLGRAQRLRNLRHAFAVAAPAQAQVQGQRVLLLDDVFTTGATLTAASHTLLAAGAAQVEVLCIARTP